MTRSINSTVLEWLEDENLRPFYLWWSQVNNVDHYYTDCDVPILLHTNLVPNGDMELDSNWSDVGTVTQSRSTDEVKYGTYSRKAIAAAELSGIESDTFELEGSLTDQITYTLDMWVYSDTLTGIKIYIVNGSGSGGQTITRSFATGSWYNINVDFLSIFGGDQAQIQITTKSGETGTFYADNVQIYKKKFYEPLEMQVDPIRYSGSAIVDKAKIKVKNANSIFTAMLGGDSAQGSASELSFIVLDDNYNIVNDAELLFKGEFDEWNFDEEECQISLVSIFYQWQKKTINRHSASCRWRVFKGDQCKYAGGETWCDRSYARCLYLSNIANFGGFRWLPKMVDKEIWWGGKQKI